MMWLKVKNGEYEHYYSVESIEKIVHGKYKDFYSMTDIAGNGVRPHDSCIIIKFKDLTEATFGSMWVMTFEND